MIFEVALLTTRWIGYIYVKENKKKFEDWLASGYAIDTRKYVENLIQATVSNASSFGFSLLGTVVSGLIPLPGATVGFVILFGVIGYVLARWGSGVLIGVLEQAVRRIEG